MGKRFAILIGVAAAGVMALGAQTAASLTSETVKVDSKVTLVESCAHHLPGHPQLCDAWLMHGRVESRKHACEVRRTVKFFERPGELRGKDKTNNHGRWRLHPRSPHGGWYYAKVLRREVVDTAGTTFVCHGDRTPTLDTH